MIKSINHIGIAVNSIEQARKLYENILGLKVSKVEDVPDQKVKVAFINVGNTKIELLESLEPNSPISTYISKKGEGVHHISLQVENIYSVLDELKNNGMQLIDEKPRYGAEGNKIAFIHPKSTNGILLELCEKI